MVASETPQPAADIRQRFLRGTFYVGAGGWGASAISVLSQLVIARLIGPSEVGLYAFVLAITEIVSILAAFSLGVALVQSREESPELYDTALAMSAALGLAAVVVSVGLAPFLWQSRTPRAAWLVIVMAIGRAVQLLAQVPLASLQRHVRYKHIGLITVVTRVVANLGAIGLAWIGMGAWSLAARDVAMASLTLLLASVWAGYRFRGRVSRATAVRLFRYAGPMFLSRGTDIVMERIDRLAIGTLLGNAATGLYHQAQYISHCGVVAIQPVMSVSLNLYSRLQDDPQRLTRAYELVNYFLARFTFFVSVPFLIFPEETVRILLGDSWIAAAPVLRCFALYGALGPLMDNLGNLFYAVDRVKWVVRIHVIQLVYFVPAVLIACEIGRLEHAAAAFSGAILLGFVLSRRLSHRVLARSVRIVRVPGFVLAATVALFAVLGTTGVIQQMPWFSRPFIAGLCFAGILVAIDRRKLMTEVKYLYRLL